jgi:hypothetical protein
MSSGFNLPMAKILLERQRFETTMAISADGKLKIGRNLHDIQLTFLIFSLTASGDQRIPSFGNQTSIFEFITRQE